ncbi:MAG TPA: hypothetical protein VHZ74_24245, partial [Bryobacteraceae bacterium]|nr:hypothetical protein [Bryobacteraceae bacterium]
PLFVIAATLRRDEGSRAVPGLPWRFLLLLGDASYSLYLSHMFVVRAVTTLIQRRTIELHYSPAYYVVVIVAAVVVAILSYRLIELPIKTTLERRLFPRGPTRRSPTELPACSVTIGGDSDHRASPQYTSFSGN